MRSAAHTLQTKPASIVILQWFGVYTILLRTDIVFPGALCASLSMYMAKHKVFLSAAGLFALTIIGLYLYCIAGDSHIQPQSPGLSQCPFRQQNVKDTHSLPKVSISLRRVYIETPWGAPIVWSFTKENAAERLQRGPFKVGLIITALANYIVFLKALIASADQFFMNSQKVTYFVLTDSPAGVSKIVSRRNIVSIEESNRGWPNNSMLRFAMISSHREQFQEMDFIFCVDVDVIFKDQVDMEALEYRVGTLHPMHYAESRSTYPYDTNPLSTASIKYAEGEYYISGAFFGGCRDEIMKLSETIHAKILRDLNELNYVARWHDESHLNRYFIDHPPTKLLSPEYYCFTSYCNLMPRTRIEAVADLNSLEIKEMARSVIDPRLIAELSAMWGS